MLSIQFGHMPEAIFDTATFFRNVYLDAWLDDPLAQRMIKSVDKSEVLGEHLIKSKALGLIPPTDLSGGVKTLLLIYNMPERVFNASACGDNCAHWILEIARRQDVAINLRHIMNFGRGRFSIKVLNTGEVAHSMAELVPMAIDHLRDGMEIDRELERTDLREGPILRVPPGTMPAIQRDDIAFGGDRL